MRVTPTWIIESTSILNSNTNRLPFPLAPLGAVRRFGRAGVRGKCSLMQQKTRKLFAVRVFCYRQINQRLNRSTNEYCVFAVFVSSSLSNAELCACSDVWSASSEMLLMLRLISSATALCSSVAAAICVVMSVMLATASLIPTNA